MWVKVFDNSETATDFNLKIGKKRRKVVSSLTKINGAVCLSRIIRDKDTIDYILPAQRNKTGLIFLLRQHIARISNLVR